MKMEVFKEWSNKGFRPIWALSQMPLWSMATYSGLQGWWGLLKQK